MPKYKNKTQFTRPMQVNGKRIALRAGEIIFSERELDIEIYDFLEKVDDKVAASTAIKEITPQKIKVAKPEDVLKVKEQITAIENTIKSTPEEIVALKEQVTTALKRLEIMKGAIETVSKENEDLKKLVKELQTDVYENGAIVIEGLDETQK
jgi:chromosome segregation ATPase